MKLTLSFWFDLNGGQIHTQGWRIENIENTLGMLTRAPIIICPSFSKNVAFPNLVDICPLSVVFSSVF